MDRVVFVTGASRGIGRGIALRFLAEGHSVAVGYRTNRELAHEVADPHPAAFAVQVDIEERESIRAAVSRTREHFGTPIGVLVNNAAIAQEKPFVTLNDQDWDRMLAINLRGPFSFIQEVLPDMLKRRSGIVINMVSGAGLNDPPAPAGEGGWGYAYAASKAAFHRMVGILAVEHLDRGVRFFNLEPGFVVSDAMRLNDPKGALAAQFASAPPEVPAAVIAWLATDPAAEEWNGKTVYAQPLCKKLGLYPGWPA